MAIDGETPETRDPRHNTGVIPLAKKIPGLRKYGISAGEVGVPAGSSGIHFVATLCFEPLNAIKASLASPQGQAPPAILPTLRTGAPSSTFSIQRTSERGRTKYADLGRCWLMSSYVSAEALEDCTPWQNRRRRPDIRGRRTPATARSKRIACLWSRADRLDAVYLRAAQAYMLISMPTGTSTIFGAFQAIRFSQVY